MTNKQVSLVAGLSLLAITFITMFKRALELEDAEQGYYAQWFRWGYDDQPPLYTWLQIGVNQIFGVHKISFSFLRGILFSGILLTLYHFSKAILKNLGQAQLVVFATVLIPVFIDLTFRRLSHTALLCISVIISFSIIYRLIKEKSWGGYVVLGLIVGVGVLSKYNYAFFLAAWGLASLFNTNLAAIITHPKILVSILISGIVVAPHAYWLFGDYGYFTALQESIVLKTTASDQENSLGILGSFLSFIRSLVSLILSLVLIITIAFIAKKVRFKPAKSDWVTTLGIAQLVVLLVFVLVFGVQKVEVRWLLPLALPYMVLLARYLQFVTIGKWRLYGFWLFMVVLTLQVLRTPAERVLGIASSVHYSFEPVSAMLQKHEPVSKWVLPDVTYAGNIKMLNPKREVFAADDFSLSALTLSDGKKKQVFFKNKLPKTAIPVDSILGFGKEQDTLYLVWSEVKID